MHFSVARRVVDRPHTLSGVHLTVKLQRRRVRKESQTENENGELTILFDGLNIYIIQ